MPSIATLSRTTLISPYVLTHQSPKGNTYFYSTLFGSLVRLDAQHTKLCRFGRNREIECPSEVFEFLKRNHFLCDDDLESNFLSAFKNFNFGNHSQFLDCCFVTGMGCNLNCPYCYEKHSSSRIPREKYDSLLDYISGGEFVRVHFAWFGGEPLLHLNDIEYFYDSFIKLPCFSSLTISGGITTNGTLLTERILDHLLNYKIKTFQITMDGAKSDCDINRPFANGIGSSFDVIFGNLSAISQLDSDFNIVIRCNVGPSTDLNSFLDFYKSNFGKDKRFSCLLYPVSNWGGDRIDAKMVSQQNYFELNKILLKQHINSELAKMLLNSNMFCEYGFPDKFVMNSDGSIGKCTLKFEQSISSLSAGNWPRSIKDLCQEESCFLYPKCFGATCPNKKANESKCEELKRSYEEFLYEYFDSLD